MPTSAEYLNNFDEMKESAHLLDDPAQLRSRFHGDGYLFLKKVLPVDELTKLRDDIVCVLERQGWIEAGANRMEANAITMPCREGEEKYFKAMDEIVRLESLYAVAQLPGLMDIMRSVLGDSAFPHPLSITRLVFPNNPEVTTPPHQDFRNNQGTELLTAAWIPLGDCPLSMGPIAVLEGSHKCGLLPLDFHLGPGNRKAVLNEQVSGLRWVAADFEVGDALLFPAMTVHRALENKHARKMRLSVDFRYQLEGEELVEQSLFPHFNRMSWESIYSNWENEQLKYYWKRKKFHVVEWDQSLQDLPDDHIDGAVKQTRNYIKKRQDRFRSSQ